MKIKTADLIGAALDWAVAKCEGKIDRCGEVTRIGNQLWCWEDGERMRYAPSDFWEQGGPIIERECIHLWKDDCSRDWLAAPFGANDDDRDYDAGPTPLIAAMRCHVAKELGDEVDVPEELL